VTLVALNRAGTVTLNPKESEVVRATDELIVAGLDEDLERVPARVTAPGTEAQDPAETKMQKGWPSGSA
jgi:uncharacterized protein with PhoU and TrkA domain